jgi:hypothetical protein
MTCIDLGTDVTLGEFSTELGVNPIFAPPFFHARTVISCSFVFNEFFYPTVAFDNPSS